MSESNHANANQSRRWLWIVAPLALAAVLVLGGAALVSNVHGHGFGRGHGFGHGDHAFEDPEQARAHIEGHVGFFLDRLDASPTQKERIVEILSGSLVELHALRERHRERHEEILDVLTGPEIDRQAIEALREQELALAEDASLSLAATLADVAEVLTPEQRAELRTWAELWHR
jgi:Spy/CpxP family protein refolding chaperone